MAFMPPATAGYFMPQGISFENEWAETSVNDQCYEVAFDRQSAMWIEHQNAARVVVRFRGALVNSAGQVAHAGIESASPYGAGDWADEWYFIYPDGVSVRLVQIYTGLAGEAVAFWGRDGTVFETQETFVSQWNPNHHPREDIDMTALTLVNMAGDWRNISFDPYPPDEGLFNHANIQIVNLLAGYYPFTIVPQGDVDILPYYGPPEDMNHIQSTTFVTWPRATSFPNGYTVALTHIVNWTWYQQTDRTMAQVYLVGVMTEERQPERIAQSVRLARAWQHASVLTITEGGFRFAGYAMDERAYELDRQSAEPLDLHLTLDGSPQSPVWNPVFIIHDAEGLSIDRLQVDDREVNDFCFGFEAQDMILWLPLAADHTVSIDVDFATGS
jgi:hypothetical protein